MSETDNPNSTKQSTEQQILVAAEEEFMQKGYAGARTTAIAERAGVTHAMLHYYFRSKESLFEKILNKKIGLIHNIMLGSIGNPNIPLFEKVKGTIGAHLDFLAENPDLPRFMINEVFYQPERVEYIMSVMHAHAPVVIANLQNQIDRLADSGECRRVDARMLIIDIISLNIFSFMASPIVNTIYGKPATQTNEFIEMRKRENIETIMRKLKP